MANKFLGTLISALNWITGTPEDLSCHNGALHTVAGSFADDGIFIPDSWPVKTVARNADGTAASQDKVVNGSTYRQTYTRDASGNVISETDANGIGWIKQ